MIYILAASVVIKVETPADILFYTLIYRVGLSNLLLIVR